MSITAAEPDALSAHGHDTGVVGQPLHPEGFVDRPGWWTGWSGTAEFQHLVGGEWVRAGPQQLAGVEVEEQQRRRLDPDPDPSSGEEFGGDQDPPGQRDGAAGGDDPVDLKSAGSARRTACGRRFAPSSASFWEPMLWSRSALAHQ